MNARRRPVLSCLLGVGLLAAAASAMVGCAVDAVGNDAAYETEVAGSFELFIGEDGQHYFRLVAADGQYLLRSEGYTRLASAENGVRSTTHNGAVRDNYELLEAQDGRWYFNVVAPNYQIVATSSALFATEADGERQIEKVRTILQSLAKDTPASITCSIQRLASTPQGEGVDAATLSILETEALADSNGIDIHDENYSFSAYFNAEDAPYIDVVFYENTHVYDEVGSVSCELPARLERGAVLCQDVIEIDIAEPDQSPSYVPVADFACRVD